MTHEEVKAAIERLEVLPEKHIYTCTDVVNAICTHNWVDTLIGILQQSDPDTHMELPRDTDGEVIHVGDWMVLTTCTTNESAKVEEKVVTVEAVDERGYY